MLILQTNQVILFTGFSDNVCRVLTYILSLEISAPIVRQINGNYNAFHVTIFCSNLSIWYRYIDPSIHRSMNHRFIGSSIHPSIHLSIPIRSIDPVIYPSIDQSINPSIHQSINPLLNLSVNRWIHLSFYPFIHPPIFPSICQSSYHSI